MADTKTDLRALRRLLEVQSAASHGMSNAAMMSTDPAEAAFIEEELDRMSDIHRLLAHALDHIEAGRPTPPKSDSTYRRWDAIRGPTAWSGSDVLDRFIVAYGGEG